MDNAMVKRGIGAIVLAIIAALLLGYLLKDKSRERQEVVEMKLPGAPEINIPSLTGSSDTMDSTTTNSAAIIVDESKSKLKEAGDSVIASATGTFKSLSESASNSVQTVTDSAKSTINDASNAVSSSSSNPGFSFRPPKQNEEKEIIDNVDTSSSSSTNTPVSDSSVTVEPTTSSNTVVASTTATAPITAKVFKPVIENEAAPVKKKVKKKAVVAKASPAKKAAPASSTASGGKYSIQLLATSSQLRANKLAKTMTGEGYIAFITQTTSNNKILYRVRVGGHNDRNSAIKAQEGMKRRYQKNFFVQNSLVVSN